jgi:hypothetical protein
VTRVKTLDPPPCVFLSCQVVYYHFVYVPQKITFHIAKIGEATFYIEPLLFNTIEEEEIDPTIACIVPTNE